MKWMYGSNTAHHLRERSQRFLLATQGAAACWAIHWSIKTIQYSLPYLKAYYFYSTNRGSYESPFFIISYKTPFTAFFVERLGRKKIRRLWVICEFVQPACCPLETITRYWGCVRTGYWGGYSDLMETKWQEDWGSCTLRRFIACTSRPHSLHGFFTSVFRSTCI